MISAHEIKLLTPADQQYLDLYGAGRYSQLLSTLNGPIQSGQATPAMLGCAALACMALGRTHEAADLAATAVRVQPGWAWLHNALAITAHAQGDLQKALTEQRLATRLVPDEPGYLALLARYERATGQAEAAIGTCRQALALDPEHTRALAELGQALREQGDRDGALQQFRRAQTVAPHDPQGYWQEGRLHLEQGDPVAARRYLRAALQRNPRLESAEEALIRSLAPTRPWLQGVLLHLLGFGRMGAMGWTTTVFLYYVGFRLLQMLWNFWTPVQPLAQAVLKVVSAYLLLGLVGGQLLRRLIRLGPVATRPT